MRLISVSWVAPLLLAGVALSGCEDAPIANSVVTSKAANDCTVDPDITPEIGGPLHHQDMGWFRRDLSHKPPSVSMDVGLVPLDNQSDEDVVIDRVQLEPEPGIASLVFKGAYVVSGYNAPPMEAARTGHYPAALEDASCYRVEPSLGPQSDPYLVLRIATGSAKGISQNRSVDIFYHTLDGKPWIAVYLYQVRFDPPTD